MQTSKEKIKGDEEAKKKQKNKIDGKAILVALSEVQIPGGRKSTGEPSPAERSWNLCMIS
jgi:hypothetical protein